jgi:hypothetical protein
LTRALTRGLERGEAEGGAIPFTAERDQLGLDLLVGGLRLAELIGEAVSLLPQLVIRAGFVGGETVVLRGCGGKQLFGASLRGVEGSAESRRGSRPSGRADPQLYLLRSAVS